MTSQAAVRGYRKKRKRGVLSPRATSFVAVFMTILATILLADRLLFGLQGTAITRIPVLAELRAHARAAFPKHHGITISLDDPDFAIGGQQDPAKWVDEKAATIQGADDEIYAPKTYELNPDGSAGQASNMPTVVEHSTGRL